MISFERINEEKLPARKYFCSSTKDGKIGDDGKISDSHISVKHYLTCEKAWDKFEMKNMDDSSIGYFLEVDLEYPDELHELHNHFPLAPEIADKYEIKVGDVKKLISNLGNKTNYVIHYSNLQLYLSLGMKLTKIHRVLKFKQSDWMKKYIDFNTEKRINAANDFEKD